MAKYEAYFQQHRERHLQELADFLRIPSVSALPAHAQDVRRAAEWAADNLRKAGVPHVEILETGGHPSVYGEWIVDESLPTYLNLRPHRRAARGPRSICGRRRLLSRGARRQNVRPRRRPLQRLRVYPDESHRSAGWPWTANRR